MTVIAWEDPPQCKHGPQDKWRRIAAELREHPGKWAVVLETTYPGNSNAVAMLKKYGTFEVTVRQINHGKFNVYARYIDNDEEV